MGKPTSPGSSRIDRILRFVALLAGPGHTASELAQRLGVTDRTVKRDLAALRGAGLELERDEQNRYSLGRRVPGLDAARWHLTDEERLGLEVLRRLAQTRLDLPFVRRGLDAVERLAGTVEPAGVDPQNECGPAIDDVLSRYLSCSLADSSLGTERQALFESVLRAIVEKKWCCVRYQGAGAVDPIEITYAPYHLYFWNRSWYVIGRSSEPDDGFRMLKLQRIQKWQSLEDSFARPEGFSAKHYLQDAWGVIPSGPRERIVLRFSAEVARNVSEVRWHESQQTRMLPDGRLEMEVVVSGVHEISWWILGYGDQVEVVWPHKLKKIIRKRAAAMVSMYEGTNGRGGTRVSRIPANVNRTANGPAPMVHVSRVEKTPVRPSSESD